MTTIPKPYIAICRKGSRISLFHSWSIGKPVVCTVCGEPLPTPRAEDYLRKKL